MRLRRTTLDRPDFGTGPRQPTCYDARDPLRPWLAAQLDTEDDDTDIELLRTAVQLGSIAPALLEGVYDPERHETIIRRPHFEDPGITSLRPLVSLQGVSDDEKALPLPRTGEHLDFAYRVGVDQLHTDGVMRFAVEIENHVAGRVQIRLLADNEGLVLTTFAATEGVLRFVVDLPRWVDKRTVGEMIQSGRFQQAPIEQHAQEGT